MTRRLKLSKAEAKVTELEHELQREKKINALLEKDNRMHELAESEGHGEQEKQERESERESHDREREEWDRQRKAWEDEREAMLKREQQWNEEKAHLEAEAERERMEARVLLLEAEVCLDSFLSAPHSLYSLAQPREEWRHRMPWERV